MQPGIEKREISNELKESYIDYAMSVIVSRALPDVRDGLKPVQRRILWTMWDSGLNHSTKLRKSASVVGDVLGKYHPHGDMAVYDALARMAQNFSLRYPLIEGQGNWGSVDGDSPAAMRYCVTGDTLIVTDSGLKTIEKISENNSEDIDIEVLSRDRAINKAVKWFDSGEHPTIKATTKYGFSVEGSYNHPILTWLQNPITGEPHFEWKLLSQIKESDIAVIERTPDLLWPKKNVNIAFYWPKDNRRWEKKTLPPELDENLAYILGALVAEGTIRENEIEFCNSDSWWINEFIKKWQKVFPDCRLHHFYRKPSSFGKKPYQTLEIHSRRVVAFLKNIGLTPVKSAGKNVPNLILQSPKSVVASFLTAYFEGDGSVSQSGKMNELSAISISEKLIQQLQIILLRFGIAAAKRYDAYRKTHKLYIRGLKNYVLFQNQIDFAGSTKRIKLQNIISKLTKNYSQTDFVPFLSDFIRQNTKPDYKNERVTHHYNFDRYSNLENRASDTLTAVNTDVKTRTAALFETLLVNNYLFDPVTKIEKGGIKKVYSLKVASECHSFVGNGFINHNTECRLSKIVEELLFDIEKETIDFTPNYDSTRTEPMVLPARFPNLLLNGAMGIAVGMATNIPPHNLSEVIEASLYLIDHPKATTEELLQFVQGPDFPTGGIIYDKKGMVETYSTGRGPITCRGKAEIEEGKKGFSIVITEIPYQVNKAELIVKIAGMVQSKQIEGIRDIRDESDREGMRIIIELKNDAAPQKILNQLYKNTDLQKDFHLNMIALVNGIQPQLLSLKEILTHYVEHRRVVVERRAKFNLARAKERAHILEGLSKALSVIDEIIATIKKSKDREEAQENLVKKFKLTDIQTDAILEMKLQSLAALERQKIEDELKEKKKLIEELELLLKSPQKILGVIKNELGEIKTKYGDERRTRVMASGLKEFKEEDLIPQEEAIITLSAGGYIKRVQPSAFKTQHRGGKGLIGSEVGEEDFLTHFLSANTHDNILFFTDSGRVFQTKVYEIPVGIRTSKGKLVQNFLEIPPNERVSAIIGYAVSDDSSYLVMATKNGLIKKTVLKDFANVRRSGLIAINLKKGDSLKWVKPSSAKDGIILVTNSGQAIRFKESQLRPMGRTATGVRAIKLKAQDSVTGLDIIKPSGKSQKLLVITENGFAKQTPLSQYKTQSRGGKGIKTAKITGKTGPLVAGKVINEEENLLAISAKGQIIKTVISDVRVASRATSGVRVMRLDKDDKLAGIVVL